MACFQSINEVLALQRIEEVCDFGIFVENSSFKASSVEELNSRIAAAILDTLQSRSGLGLDDFQ